jgi:hypothetical protein
MATARARASFCLRVCDRSAEYACRLAAADFVVALVRDVVLAALGRVFVAASAEDAPKWTRLTSARDAIQKFGFLCTWADPIEL